MVTMHLVLEYNTIYFVFGKGLTLPCNCFISAAIIFPKTSSADSSHVIRVVDFSSFSFMNLDMFVIT